MTDRGKWLRRFPIMVVLGSQYAVFAILPALSHHDGTALLVEIIGLGLFAPFLVEAILAPLRRPSDEEGLTPPRWAVSRSVIVLTVGVGSQIAIALLSPNAYAVQLGSVSRSPIVSLLTPFSYWTLIGSVLVLVAWRTGQISAKLTVWLLAVASAALLVLGIRQGLLGPFRDYAVTMALIVLLMGAVRLRVIVLVGIAVVLIIPTVLHVRDQQRLNNGANPAAIASSEQQSRLREDVSINQLGGVPLPLDIGQPSLNTAVQYGLIPSRLEPNRPPLQTGTLVDNALTGGNTSSATFTILGNVYAFEGYTGEVLYVAAVALLAAFLLWRRTPFRLAIFALLVNTTLMIEVTYPDGIAALLQSMVALIPVYVICRATITLPRRESKPLAWSDEYETSVWGRDALEDELSVRA